MANIAQILKELLSETHRQTILLGKIFKSLPDETQDKDYFFVGELAKKLNKSPSTIRRWISEGKLTSVKLNKGSKQDHHMIPRSSIEKLLSNSNI